MCVVLSYYDRTLSLQKVFCVCQLWDRNWSGKLCYSFSDKTTLFYQGWCAWDGRRAYLFSLPQMKNLGITLELDPKGAKNYTSSFWLVLSPVEYSTMGDIVLDLSCPAYQPKSRERSARPTKHVTFTLSREESAYPAHPQDLDDDEDDKPVVLSDRTIGSEKGDEDNKPLVQPASKESADAWIFCNTKSSYTVRKKKRTSNLARSVCHTETRCVGNFAWTIRRRLEFGQKFRLWSSSENYQQVVGCSQLEGPSLEALPHVYCAVQEEDDSHWTFLERFMTFVSMWWRQIILRLNEAETRQITREWIESCRWGTRWFLIHLRRLHIPLSRWTKSQTLHSGWWIISHSTEIYWRHQSHSYYFGCIAGEPHRWLLGHRWIKKFVWSMDRFHIIHLVEGRASRRIHTVRGRGLTKRQATSRPDQLWPEIPRSMSRNSKMKRSKIGQMKTKARECP